MLWVCNTILWSFQSWRIEALFCLEFPGEVRNLKIPGSFKKNMPSPSPSPLLGIFSGIAHYIPQHDARYMKSSPGSTSQRVWHIHKIGSEDVLVRYVWISKDFFAKVWNPNLFWPNLLFLLTQENIFWRMNYNSKVSRL